MRLTIEEVDIILIGYNYAIILLHIFCLGKGDSGWVWGLWHSNLLKGSGGIPPPSKSGLIHFQAHLTDRFLTNKSASCQAENDPLYMTVVT